MQVKGVWGADEALWRGNSPGAKTAPALNQVKSVAHLRQCEDRLVSVRRVKVQAILPALRNKECPSPWQMRGGEVKEAHFASAMRWDRCTRIWEPRYGYWSVGGRWTAALQRCALIVGAAGAWATS